ncbi:4-(cytidine 5'-diphospho)-2-C-methyl-D-erythritol kinase [Desulfobacula sp.]|uniref:4-(cytidine 5'-diphospho)-2-C-methyl-D-erythritol kinase n=1 Tax=Desulfobacula sp. TaxID=2593537 RepID=UPI002638EB5B|nr:4-(cytidine 5'-diphospho)-2-C-methyl-D-erythritol kinase [Desulfobacula sp.]
MIKKVKSFAKINLFLYVTSRRKDGYHNLYSLMTQIDLCDDIYIDFSKKNLSIACDHPDVPEDESNLAYKAAVLFYHSLKINGCEEKKDLSIEIIKRIPPGGGLGGGSSNAAAVLIALNARYKMPFSKAELMKMGLNLGADVPFFIFGSPAIAKGIGERLEKALNLRPYHLVLCDPGIFASTANVYKNIDFRLTLNQKYNKKTGLNVPLRGQEFDVRDQMHNDLEESACRLYPEIKEIKEEMELLLKRRVGMTGSGSSLFALFSARENANKGYERLLKKWAKSKRKVFLSSFK